VGICNCSVSQDPGGPPPRPAPPSARPPPFSRSPSSSAQQQADGASYQIEGAAHEDGRADSIWDTFAREPGRIADAASGDVACDSYRRRGEDVALLRSLGARAYRFSVSWPRVVPLGGRADPVNAAGLEYYVGLVGTLRRAGVEPVATLYHWDLPAELERRYGGLRCKDEFAADFERYARVVFAALGPWVRWWITFNEPWCSAILGYHSGTHAPGRCSDPNVSPAGGDSAVEPWVAGHSILVAHGRAVRAFREEFKPKFGGQIAITLNGTSSAPPLFPPLAHARFSAGRKDPD
jgi:beta-glucosidase